MSKKNKAGRTLPYKKAAAPLAEPSDAAVAILWPILGLGLFIKILYLIFSRQSPFYEPLLLDPAYYHQWALKIVNGDFIGDPVFYGLPLYPFFVALCYKLFNGSVFAVKLIQIFLGVITLFLIYKITITSCVRNHSMGL